MTERPRAGQPGLMLLVISLAGISYSLLSSMVVPALPAIQDELHTTTPAITWVVTAYLLSAAVGTAIIGRLGDIHGKRRVLLATLSVLAAGTLLAAITSSIAVLIAARAIQGLGGGLFPLTIGIVRDEFPPERVPGAIGPISALLGVGGGAGLSVGGVIVEHLGWHWLFWIPLLVTLVSAAGVRAFVPESPVRAPGRVNWLAAALLSSGIAAILVALSGAPTLGWEAPRTLGAFASGLVLCGSWIALESRSREPLVDMTVMRIRGVWTTNVAAFCVGAGMYALFSIIPRFLELPRTTGFGLGASVIVAGLYLLPLALANVVTSLAAGPIARRIGSKGALLAGAALIAVGYALLVPVHGSAGFIVGATTIGAGIGLAFSALGNLTVQAVPPQETGVATGINTVMRLLGGSLGAQLAATLIEATAQDGIPALSGFTHAMLMASGLVAVCLVIGPLIPGGREGDLAERNGTRRETSTCRPSEAGGLRADSASSSSARRGAIRL